MIIYKFSSKTKEILFPPLEAIPKYKSAPSSDKNGASNQPPQNIQKISINEVEEKNKLVNQNERKDLDHKGRTPLHLAIIDEDFELTMKLIANGKDINVPDIYNMTPIFYSIDRNNNSLIFSELVKAGAKLDIISVYGLSFHGVLIQLNKLPLLKHMNETGFDMRELNHCGESMLDLAFKRGSLKMIEYLANFFPEREIIFPFPVIKLGTNLTSPEIIGETAELGDEL